jgi:hypothetical protein
MGPGSIPAMDTRIGEFSHVAYTPYPLGGFHSTLHDGTTKRLSNDPIERDLPSLIKQRLLENVSGRNSAAVIRKLRFIH